MREKEREQNLSLSLLLQFILLILIIIYPILSFSSHLISPPLYNFSFGSLQLNFISFHFISFQSTITYFQHLFHPLNIFISNSCFKISTLSFVVAVDFQLRNCLSSSPHNSIQVSLRLQID